MLVGVDIGGTFTDFVVSDDDGLRIHKRLSTPGDPAAALLAGLAEVGATGADRVAHGTTVTTNAILERRGARTALIVTRGFRDLLAIGRQARPVLYALHPTLPPPLIPRDLCLEVTERLDHAGQVLTPLDAADLDAALDELVRQGAEAVAVCLLHSFLNPTHERTVRERIVARGILSAEQIALSSDVLPEFREYERASTTALDAYVRPVLSGYLRRLEVALPGGSDRLLVMKSDGGLARSAAARNRPAHTALSGPAAGVIGATHLARLAGYRGIITLDIGGTSTDVALCPDGPVLRTEAEIDGLPLRLPTIDIATVGAGGGSLARIDPGGALRVGPESAGAEPGPICYGRGGQGVTVSDANAVLGRLDPDHFLGGRMTLRVDLARAALADFGARLGGDGEQAARGMLEVATANIVRAVRGVSVERGADPRDFALVAFGGAGPLHAAEVAAALGMPTVVVPRHPGVLCALGLLVADVTRRESRTRRAPADAAHLAELRAELDAMIHAARAALLAEGFAPDRLAFNGALDLRYTGQSYELTVPFAGQVVASFHAAHQRRFGYARPERAVEVVTLRLEAVAFTDKPVFAPQPLAPNDGRAARLPDAPGGLARYDRERLTSGAAFPGPALVFQLDSTTFVPPGWSAQVDEWGNLVLRH